MDRVLEMARALSPADMALSAVLIPSYTLEVLLAVYMVAATQPHRPRFRLRRAVVLGIYLLGSYVLTPLVYGVQYTGALQLDGDLSAFGGAVLLMLSTIPALMLLFDVSAWKALFCATAGWTCQNLASGIEGFISLLLERVGGLSLDIPAGMGDGSGAAAVRTALIAAVFSLTYVACYLLFVRRIHRRGLGELEDHRMLAVLALVILAVIAFDVVNKRLDAQGTDLTSIVILRLVHGAVCTFVLFMAYEMLYSRSLETQVALDAQMAAERERQWQLSQENREAINVRMHDIRHQVRVLADGAGAHVNQEFLADLARKVDVYDSLMDTGNEALDTILSEKALVCEREAIELSCIADGAALGFMSAPEVYSLFGNALDNAMRAVREVDDPERRSISLVVRRVGELVSIHVENYFVGSVSFEDGLPRTTQEGPGHGLGTRSMRGIVERHGGTLALGTRGDVFTLDALIPLSGS